MMTKILALSLGLGGLLAYVGCGGDSSTGGLGTTAGTTGAGAAGSTVTAGSGQGGDESGQGGANEAGGDSGGSAGDAPSGTGGGGGAGSANGQGGAAGSEDDAFAGPTVCTSKTTWTQGNHESPNMHPGGTCISCHKQKEANKSSLQFTVAGTVFPTGHEPTDCNGVNASTTPGVEIEITGADGVVTTLPVTQSSGNFYKKFSLKTPYTALVRYQGKERAMAVAQTSGDCNSCHTEDGTEGAPGRLALP